MAVSARLKAHGIDGGVHFGFAEDLGEEVGSAAPLDRSTVSQPKLRAWARRSGFMSPTMTTEAPRIWTEWAAASPTGPAPAT